MGKKLFRLFSLWTPVVISNKHGNVVYKVKIPENANKFADILIRLDPLHVEVH